MNLKHKALFVVLLIVFGCAPLKPARVENGLYLNPYFHFSLSVPDGWEVSEKIPEVFKNKFPLITTQVFKSTFSDFQNKRIILVAAEPTELDWFNFKMYSDKFIANIDQYYSREQKKCLKDPNFNYYRYEIYQDKIKNCAKNCIGTKIDFGNDDVKATGYNIIYDRTGMLYAASLIMIAREESYEDSLKILKTIVDSFKSF